MDYLCRHGRRHPGGAAACCAGTAGFRDSAGAKAERSSPDSRAAHAKQAQVPPPPPATAKPKLPPRIAVHRSREAPPPSFPACRTRGSGRIRRLTSIDALPPQPGPWLILSTGGADGAFGAGLLNGLSAAGTRPDYAVVTGVSTGALMAPFAFAGSRYDDALQAAYTQISAADIFEVGGTGESFVDSWPLKDLIAKQITPALLADIAAEHQRGRRLVRGHDRSRRRALRGLEHGRHRGPRRRRCAQSVPQRAAGVRQPSRAPFRRC